MRDGSNRRRVVLKGQWSSLLVGGIVRRAMLMSQEKRVLSDACFLGRSRGEGNWEKKCPPKPGWRLEGNDWGTKTVFLAVMVAWRHGELGQTNTRSFFSAYLQRGWSVRKNSERVAKRRNVLQERWTHRKDGVVTLQSRLFFSIGTLSSRIHKLAFAPHLLCRTKT